MKDSIPNRSLSRSGSLSALILASVLSVAAVSTLGAQTAPASQDRHVIRFERPRAVGARFRVEVSGEKSLRMEQRGVADPVRDERTLVRMVAVERVVAVNSIGEATVSEYTIETLEVDHVGQRTTPLARGTVLLLTRATTPTEQPRMQVAGADVAPEVASALAVVLTRKASGVSDDDVFGSTRPRRVGERWSIASAVAEREAANAGMPGVRLRGQVTVNELATVDQVPCLVLSATMTGRLSAIPNMPSIATFVSGSMETTLRGAFPVDGTSRQPTGEMTMVVNAAFTINPGSGPVQSFTMVVRESRTEHVTPLP